MLEGVYVANVTPFEDVPSYPLDKEAYLAHAEWLGKQGVDGLVPFGTNGEGPSVSLKEKFEVLEALFSRCNSLQIIPTLAEGNLPDTLELLRKLEEFPAEAILVLPPYYYKPTDYEGLRRFFDPVLEATSHQIIAYHIPKYAVPIPGKLVGDLPIWGVKDSSGDAAYSEDLLRAGKGVLIGTEDELWSRLEGGAQGVISALANFMPEQVVRLFKAFRANDLHNGQMLSEHLQRVRAMTKKHPTPAILKKLAEGRHSVPLGTVRPPLQPAAGRLDVDSILDFSMNSLDSFADQSLER